LAGELSAYAQKHPDHGVSLLTHSMGGLVARAVIEDPELDPGNVRQLIMVCPPNGGSRLAHFGFALDLAEHMADPRRRREVGLLAAIAEDGLSEAAADLVPESPLLHELNSRPRNPHVRYSIFLGTKAVFTRAQMQRWRERAGQLDSRNRWLRFFGPRFRRWLDDLDELVHGQGDGVVAVRRGRLDGVEDMTVLHVSHLDVLQNPPEGDVLKLRRMIYQRLLDASRPQ